MIRVKLSLFEVLFIINREMSKSEPRNFRNICLDNLYHKMDCFICGEIRTQTCCNGCSILAKENLRMENGQNLVYVKNKVTGISFVSFMSTKSLNRYKNIYWEKNVKLSVLKILEKEGLIVFKDINK